MYYNILQYYTTKITAHYKIFIIIIYINYMNNNYSSSLMKQYQKE